MLGSVIEFLGTPNLRGNSDPAAAVALPEKQQFR